ncbi:acyltransferase ChoActase/COT/CPT [Mycena galopus ATCC 62051]|nr:acyltransferase ChoActase/COT/CPT [Mycena galopus ATCC 62051]
MLRLKAARFTRRCLTVTQPRKASMEVPPKGYSIDPSASPMLRYQASLPRLPVPPLWFTAHRYLESARPHLTPAQYASTEAAVQAFVQSPQSAELQKRLEARAADPPVLNWMSEWLDKVMYSSRNPVAVFSSYFYVHVDDPLRTKSAQRAASLLKVMLSFRHMVETKQLEPDKVRGVPLCMDSYESLFHSCRYPNKPSDTVHKFDPATHNHVVFIRKNRFYLVSLVHPSGQELSAAELEIQIERIIELAGDTRATAVGALTSDNRDNWTDTRAALLATDPANAASLEAIESAMIVVCLDDAEPIGRELISVYCWAGDGHNRFYDKHQLIVFDNGRSGFMGQSGLAADALRMNEFVLAALALGQADLGTPSGEALPAPTELSFTLNDPMRDLINGAEWRFVKMAAPFEARVLHYEGYGKDMVERFGVDPDAWAHLIMQLAFRKMFNWPALVAEHACGRRFQLGSAQVILSTSSESKAWAEAMLDSSEINGRRAVLFREAAARHQQQAAWAVDGQSPFMHLAGLVIMAVDPPMEELPEIFAGPAFWGMALERDMDTAQLSSPYLDGWGFGGGDSDTFGLAYSIGNKYIRWTITSARAGDAQGGAQLKEYLAEAATQLRDVMDAATEEKKE